MAAMVTLFILSTSCFCRSLSEFGIRIPVLVHNHPARFFMCLHWEGRAHRWSLRAGSINISGSKHLWVFFFNLVLRLGPSGVSLYITTRWLSQGCVHRRFFRKCSKHLFAMASNLTIGLENTQIKIQKIKI